MKRRRPALRDQDASVFNAILVRLCDASGAIAAALVDASGETVDYAGRLSPYDARVAAAEWRIVLSVCDGARAPLNGVRELLVRARTRSYAAFRLGEGYALVLVLPRGAFRVSPRAVAEAAEALVREAGLELSTAPAKLRWTYSAVREAPGERRRPEAVWHEGAWQTVTILGRFQRQGLAVRETGYLVRFATGPELLLVREPLGKWFLGQPV